MKRGIILIMATIAFLACCVQAVRLDYVGKEELLGQQTFVASEGLRLESIEVPKPEDVVLSECSLANETAVISQLVLSSELSEEDIQNIVDLLEQTSIKNKEISLQIKARFENKRQMYNLKLHTLWTPLKKDGYIGIIGYFDIVK